MPADRFFLDAELKKGASVLLDGPEYHHLAHVMRLAVDEPVDLVNGRGDLALGKVALMAKKRGQIQISETRHESEPLPRLFLGAPLMRPSKLEWVVEKGTELGIAAFLFYPAAYSEKTSLSAHQLDRLRAQAISALKQSGRLYLPSIELLPNIESLLKREALVLFGDPHAKEAIAPSPKDTLFITGPEKGFSPEEMVLLSKQGKGVRLSPYTLRAETAPIAAASILGLAISLGSP